MEGPTVPTRASRDDWSHLGAPLIVAWAFLAVSLFSRKLAGIPSALPLAIGAAAIVWLSFPKGALWTNWPKTATATRVVVAVLLLQVALLWQKPLGAALVCETPAARALLSATALIAIAGFFLWRERAPQLRLALMLALWGVAGITLIFASPSPPIDVFIIQQEGARDLWAKHNPYCSLFSNPYTPQQTTSYFGEALKSLYAYPYPPLTLLLTSLSWQLTGDVRYALLLAQFVTAVGIYVLSRQAEQTRAISLGFCAMFLLHPRGEFVLEQSWTEPILCAAFVWTLCASRRKARPSLGFPLALALGAFLATKQYSLLLLPFFANPRFGRLQKTELWGGLTIAAAITLPFVLWDWREFFRDVIAFQVRQPFRPHSLSIAPLLAHHTGIRTGLLSPIAALLAGTAAWRRAPSNLFGLCLCSSLCLLAFFLTAKQAFCNYYYFVGITVLCAAILAPKGTSTADS